MAYLTLYDGKLLVDGASKLKLSPSVDDPCCCDDKCDVVHVSVIDEDDSYNATTRTREWCIFRAAFPDRNFFLLRPLPQFSPLNLPQNWDGTGPITVGRPFSGSDNVTDWFAVMGLTDKIKSNTRVVLSVDNSGSMTLSTVRASYDLFLAKLAELPSPITEENGRLKVVLSGGDENWICPHLTQTFDDECPAPGCTCEAALASDLELDLSACGCECCITETFSSGSINKAPGNCPATIYGERVITRPTCSSTGPVTVKITGIVDDDLVINGEIIEPGLYPFDLSLPCNGAHTIGNGAGYSFTLNADSFTIAVADNFGFVASYNLKICFTRI